MPMATTSSKDRIGQLTALTRDLRRLIESETLALSERRPMALKETEADKARLARLYWAEMGVLRADQTLKEGAPKDVLEKLKLETKAFHESLAAHERAVRAAKTVSERMIHAIAKGAHKISQPQAGYGNNAAYAAGAKPKAFALNSVA